MTWEREGGIAGFCDGVIVYASGKVLFTSCRGGLLEEGYLPDGERERVVSWVQTFKPLEYVQSDGAVADSMTVRLTLAGQGAQEATEADVQAMLDFVAALLSARSRADTAVLQTGVRYVLVTEDVAMYAGPGAGYPQIDQVFSGQVAWVTGVSADEAW